jgi:hypothetical protein
MKKKNDMGTELNAMISESLAVKLGRDFADVIMSSAHMTYNAPRGIKIVRSCIERLQERIDEIQPKKATLTYKIARYGKKKRTNVGKRPKKKKKIKKKKSKK